MYASGPVAEKQQILTAMEDNNVEVLTIGPNGPIVTNG
jgi:hypothetical protein